MASCVQVFNCEASEPDRPHSVVLASLMEALHTALEDTEVQQYISSVGGLERCLLRWLHAYKFSIPNAQKNFEVTLKWRNKVQANGVLNDVDTLEWVKRFKALWPAAYCGSTPAGLSIVFTRVGQLNPKRIMSENTEEELIRFFVFWLEMSNALQCSIIEQRQQEGKPCSSCNGQLEIYDCSGLSLWQVFHVKGIRMFAHIVGLWSQHYPGNMYRGFVINAPSIFNIAWKIIKPAISEQLQSCISIHSDGAEKELAQFLDAEQLQAVFRSVPEPATERSQ
eukprot:GGOE01014075.1.p1 GENE.GGOE01014075.1~~GGOE01014075.1.p1  ORF type:complete len:280 (-),score=40.83 GGOE01014075.1:276-1115(-)